MDGWVCVGVGGCVVCLWGGMCGVLRVCIVCGGVCTYMCMHVLIIMLYACALSPLNHCFYLDPTPLQVRGYPTIKFFPAGRKSWDSAQEYDGGRTSQDIVQWAMDRWTAQLPPPEIYQVSLWGWGWGVSTWVGGRVSVCIGASQAVRISAHLQT